MLAQRKASELAQIPLFHGFVGLKKTVTKLCIYFFPIQLTSCLKHNFVCLNYSKQLINDFELFLQIYLILTKELCTGILGKRRLEEAAAAD